MARKRFGINFKGVEETFERLDKLNGDVKRITEKALEASFNVVTPGVESTIQPHRLSGSTEKSLVKNPTVKWEGGVAKLPVGFDISNGGLPSIFLMYGTPTVTPDKKIYNSIYGTSVKKRVSNIQSEIFHEEIERLMK